MEVQGPRLGLWAAAPLSPTLLGGRTRSVQAGLVRQDSSPGSRQDIPSAPQMHGTPAEEVGEPCGSRSGKRGDRQPLHGRVPGALARHLCFLTSFTPSSVLSGAGLGSTGPAARAPPPPPPRREQRSQTWTGRGLPGIAVGNLWPGCCQVTFCFTSQVPAFCGRDDIRLPWHALQPAPTSARLPHCPGTAVPRPFPAAQARSRGDSHGVFSVRRGASHARCATCSRHLPTSALRTVSRTRLLWSSFARPLLIRSLCSFNSA